MKISRQARVLIYFVLIILVLIINLPIISMIGTAFKSKAEFLSSSGILPKDPSLDNFINVLSQTKFGLNLLNSIVYSCVVTALAILFAILGGYAISRFKGIEFSIFGLSLFFFQMFPFILFLIPLYLLFSKIGLNNSPIGVIIGYLSSTLPFSIWMLKGFFDNIPIEMEHSAMIDGCSYWQLLWKVVVPVSLPGIATVGIFTFIRSWNEYLLISVLIQKQEWLTLTVGLQKFVQENAIDWGGLSAASTLSIIPSLLFLLMFQKYLISGLTSGSVKG